MTDNMEEPLMVFLTEGVCSRGVSVNITLPWVQTAVPLGIRLEKLRNVQRRDGGLDPKMITMKACCCIKLRKTWASQTDQRPGMFRGYIGLYDRVGFQSIHPSIHTEEGLPNMPRQHVLTPSWGTLMGWSFFSVWKHIPSRNPGDILSWCCHITSAGKVALSCWKISL